MTDSISVTDSLLKNSSKNLDNSKHATAGLSGSSYSQKIK